MELFAGAGGLGMGVGRAGFEPALVVEWNRWCCDTLRENRARESDVLGRWPEPTEADVRDVDFRALEGRIDLATGGPPCQPFSQGGKHGGHTDKRDMWPEAVRAVRETRPAAFVFENVKGMTRRNFANYFAYVLHQLHHPEITRRDGESQRDHLARLERHRSAGRRAGRGLSYNVVWRVLNAADHGVPQRRERVFFVGFRDDLGVEWSFPPPTHSLDALLWRQARGGEYWEEHGVPRRERRLAPRMEARARRLPEKPAARPWRTVRDAVSDLPDPEREPRRAAAVPGHRFQPGARAYPGHTGSPMDEPAKTLKAGANGVPGGENMLARPDGSVRYFSVRESARLQTFPDAFRLRGAWTEVMRQLGNAVPVDLAAVVARGVRGALLEAGVGGGGR